ncbi:MAG: response regulator transcription factor [Patescibacteria group bacterium]
MKILIIEDDIRLAQALKRGLEQESYAVDILNDGIEGEKRMLLNHTDYDLLILDLTLPGKDGFEICTHLRQQNINLPILILTGHVGTEDKVRALDSGADDYLTKPFSVSELAARARALMRRQKETVTPELTVEDIVLNPSSKKVYRAGKEVKLTLKEFSILEYFMRNPGQVIMRDQLLDHVWDFNFRGFSNVVDVHITNLRKKLNKGKMRNILETIRGVGYRLSS